MSDRGHSLGTRTLRGMAWAYGAYVGGRLLVLASTAILTRLLTPEDFGVVALTLTFMVFLDAVKDLGLAQAVIISDEHNSAVRAQTAFSWSVLIGLTLTLATAAAAPFAASFFHEPGLHALLPLMGCTFAIRSLGSIHAALARKELNYRVRTASELADVGLRGIVGILLALLDFGAWSLVIGYVTGAAASTVMLWLRVPFRPTARVSRVHLREMLAFGGMLTLVDIGAVLSYNLDYVFIGRILGTTALGLYTIGFRLPELLVLNLATIAGDVLFPAYAAVDRERLRSAYLLALRYTAMLTLPIAAVLVVLAHPVILVLFGDQWAASANVMQVLALQSAATTLVIPAGTIYKVTGKAWILVAFTIPSLLLLVVLLVAFTDQGIMAVAICSASLQGIDVPLTALVASRVLRLPFIDSVRAMAPAALAASIMTAVMVGAERVVAAPFLALLVVAPLGLAVYLGCLLVFAREDLRRLRQIALPRLAAS